jgi:hypothetical protein
MADSIHRLRLELLSVNALAWIVTVRGDELSIDTHAYLFDRYDRLAACHRRRGHLRRAERLQEKADWHWEFLDETYLDDDDLGAETLDGPRRPRPTPPRAAAMALPRRRQQVFTDAVSRSVRRRPQHRP